MTDSTQSSTPADDLNEGGTELTGQHRGTPKVNLESPHDAARRAIDEGLPDMTLEELEQLSDEEKMHFVTIFVKHLCKMLSDEGIELNTVYKQLCDYFQKIEKVKTVFPSYLEAELVTLHKDFPETSDISAQVLLRYLTQDLQYLERFIKKLCQEHGIQPTTELLKAFETAITNANNNYVSSKQSEPEQQKAAISIGGKRPLYSLFPVDKPNTLIFDGLVANEIYKLSAEKRGTDTEITTYLLLETDEESPIQYRLMNAYEKRLYIACDSLQRAGNNIVSATQIFKEMNIGKNPSTTQIEKIRDTCERLAPIRASIDNEQEAKAYNYPRYPKGRFYIFPIISVEEKVAINGKTADYAIQFISDLPLIRFAEKRGGQVQRCTREQLALPDGMRWTDDNLLLDDKLRTRIYHMKTGTTEKIALKWIYDNCYITERYQKTRAIKKIRLLLTQYVKVKIIKKFTESEDGFTIQTIQKTIQK